MPRDLDLDLGWGYMAYRRASLIDHTCVHERVRHRMQSCSASALDQSSCLARRCWEDRAGNSGVFCSHVRRNERSIHPVQTPGLDWTNPAHSQYSRHINGHILFQYPGNLPELPGLTPVLVRKRTANLVEVVATPVTEMLQCDMPCWSRGILYVLCLLFGQYWTTTTYLPKMYRLIKKLLYRLFVRLLLLMLLLLLILLLLINISRKYGLRLSLQEPLGLLLKQVFQRLDALPVAQPTAPQHWRNLQPIIQ